MRRLNNNCMPFMNIKYGEYKIDLFLMTTNLQNTQIMHEKYMARVSYDIE